MESIRDAVIRQAHKGTYERIVDADTGSKSDSTVEKYFTAMVAAAEKRRDEMLPGLNGYASAFRAHYRRQVYLCHAALMECGRTTATPVAMLVKALAAYYDVNAWGHAIPDKSTDECLDLLNEWMTLDQMLLMHYRALSPALVEAWIKQILEAE